VKRIGQAKTLRRRLYLLTLLSEGYTHRQVAIAMGMSKDNVEADTKALRIRYGAKNTVHLIALAFRRGLLRAELNEVAAYANGAKIDDIARSVPHPG